MPKSLSSLQAHFVLAALAILASANYLPSKVALLKLTPATLAAWRFIVGGLAIACVLPKRALNLRRKELIWGMVTGALFILALIPAFYSMRLLHSGITAFLMGCCAIFVPFLEYYALKRIPSKWQCGGLFVAIIGVALLAVRPGLILDLGTLYGLTSAVLFACWAVSLSYSVRFVRPISLGVSQIFGAAIVAFVISFSLGEFSVPHNAASWTAILYLGLIGVAFRFLTQTWTQQFTSATSTEIVFLVEPCGAMLWGYLFGGEHPSAKQLFACVVIISGILLAQVSVRKSVTSGVKNS